MTGNRILIVDNSIDSRMWFIESVARPAGYVTAEASNLIEARAQITTFQPHLIVLAMSLSNTPGLLREYEATLPIIITTTRRSVDEIRAALQAGARDVLVKPFEPEEMAQTITRQLRNDQLARDYGALRMQTERQTQEFNAIYTIGKKITALLDIEEILTSVVSAAVNLTHAEEGSLLLLDPDNGELFLRAHKNLDDATTQHLRIKVNDTLMGRVLESRRPLMLASDEMRKLKTSFLVKSILATPIIVGGQAIGLLIVDNKLVSHPFNEHELHLLGILSDYAGIALENARLYWTTENERQQLYAILRDTQDAVIVTDPNLRIILINQAARSAFGLKAAPVGVPLSEVIDNRAVLDLFQQGATHEHSRRSEILLRDGRTLQGHCSRVDGIGFGVVMQDISQLKELDRIKGEFISTVSHDLRTPLTAIRGYIELLPRVGPLNDMQQDFVARVEHSMINMVGLISDLLNISRIEAGLDWEMESTELHKVIWDCAINLEQNAVEKHQTLHLDIAPETTILGNAQRLQQVISNLVGNAIKYTPEGGRIDVTLRADGDFAIFQVRDNGIGIAFEHQPRVFDKFYRIETDETLSISGTGLGLSIVKTIVEKHKGRVWVESEAGRGSTFTVLLPIHLPQPMLSLSPAPIIYAAAY